jgi:HEAT repeat protein
MAVLASPQDAPARKATIIAALEAESPPVRDAAIAWAARCLEPNALTQLVADGENAILRNSALAALERQGPYAVSHLEGMLTDSDTDVVMFAVQLLAQIRAPAAAPALLPLVKHPEPNVAQSAVDALGRLHAAEAVPELIGLLRSDLWLKLAAIEALAEIGDARAAGPLYELTADPLMAVPALHAVERIGAPESLLPLLTALVGPSQVSLREPLIRAVAGVLERSPGLPLASAREFSSVVENDRSDGGLWRYLLSVISEAEAEGSAPDRAGVGSMDDRQHARGGGPTTRSASTVVIALGIRSLFPWVLARAAEREGAAWVEPLCKRYPNALAPELMGLLRNPDSGVRQGTLIAAALGPEHAAQIMERLGDDVSEVRAAAAWTLGQLRVQAATPILIERLREGSPAERAAAVAALGRMPPDVLDGLGECLQESGAVLLGALEVLDHSKCRTFDWRALELARASEPAVRKAALRIVADMDGARADVVLLRALADRDEGVQAEALDLLVSRGGSRIEQTLLSLLGTGDSLRYHVIRALGRLRSAGATGPLYGLFTEAPLHERIEVISALVRIAPPGITAFLTGLLQDAEVEVRRGAARGIATLAEARDLPLLETLAADSDWSVRCEAARGLGRMGLPECQPLLLQLVRDLEPVVARAARRALDDATGGPRSSSS